jgi:hypothetical protein
MVVKTLKAVDKSSSLGGFPATSRTRKNKEGHASLILNSRKFMYHVQTSFSPSRGSPPKTAIRNRLWDGDSE